MAYPILLVHGMGFRDRRLFNYWGRLPKMLESMGFEVYYGRQDSNASIETNGRMIAERIEDIIAKTGSEKLNIIAHSKGGLDTRYALSTLGMGKYAATLTTLQTPHHGSITVDKLLKLPDILVKIVGKCTDIWFRILGDKRPESYKVFHSLTTAEAEIFNSANPDCEGVRYRSYAFVMKGPLSDIVLCFTNMVVAHFEGENDGLLAPRAVKWGEFMGVKRSVCRRGISHCDEVDMRRRKFSDKKGEGVSDILEVYKEIAESLP
ncbi:hypothetical protein [Ruminococcus sp.]|uniref:esterase/lipase family protein n=1 Tax=Ruminococcus sp. TaxID=41978 RepID=UPI0025D3CC6C|nr:hypothetical protein [Ruminococcus sp.]MBQ8965320.1 hypothetical protein [Ruminococcus sp.]